MRAPDVCDVGFVTAIQQRGWRIAMRVALAAIVGVIACVALFAWNGTRETWRTPQSGTNGDLALHGSYPDARGRTVRVMALNVAKCWFHRGGLDFTSRDEVRENLDRIARVIDVEKPDVVCLSEVVMEGGPVRIDQVDYLAAKCSFVHWASAENYSFGLPFLRIRSGNAVLSNLEMRALDVQQLAGAESIWDPTNVRRALWFEIRAGGAWWLGASIRNDSFDLVNNARQVEQILARIGERPALLAGDFNSVPGTPSMEQFRASGCFVGILDGPPTFPADAPDRRLDQVLAPATWTVVEARIVDTGVSDHLAVITTFRLPD